MTARDFLINVTIILSMPFQPAERPGVPDTKVRIGASAGR